jgi:hypothetical protein
MHSGNDRARNWLAQRASAAASASTAAASAAATRLPTQAPEHLRAREGGGGCSTGRARGVGRTARLASTNVQTLTQLLVQKYKY